MKNKFFMLFAIALLAVFTCAALAYDYSDDTLAAYEVNLTNGQGLIYMYPRASSSGNPIATYANGTIVRVIDYNASANYCQAVGPDNKVGYLRKAYLVEVVGLSYDDETLEEYRVVVEFSPVYMFPVPSDSGEPNSAYDDGTVLKLLDYDSDATYAYVIGPDGKAGYIRKTYIMKVYDYEDETYDAYRVTSTYATGYLYMYPTPGTSSSPIATYYNDTVLKVIDYYSSEAFCLAVGPDGKSGYVSKRLITAETSSGSLGPVFEVFSSRHNCYMYAKPTSGTTNLGRYDNGEQIEIIDWSADANYAFVRGVKDNKYGYIQKASLHPSSINPVKGYMKIKSASYSFAYLYEKASDGSKNLGRYSNGTQVGILDWAASEKYALVCTEDDKIGYIKKNCLISLFD